MPCGQNSLSRPASGKVKFRSWAVVGPFEMEKFGDLSYDFALLVSLETTPSREKKTPMETFVAACEGS